jgi:hypothetical protein
MSGSALEAARQAAAAVDPQRAAERCGFTFEEHDGEGVLRAGFLGAEVGLSVPGFEQVSGDPLPPHVLAILVYHIATSDGTEPEGRWIAFTELPDGTFYVSAWRGYTGEALVRRFGNDVETVARAAATLGVADDSLPGDVVSVMEVFPRVPIAFVYWVGDDEFEPRADFLFDATASRHLATDCLAVCCSWIVGLIGRAV